MAADNWLGVLERSVTGRPPGYMLAFVAGRDDWAASFAREVIALVPANWKLVIAFDDRFQRQQRVGAQRVAARPRGLLERCRCALLLESHHYTLNMCLWSFNPERLSHSRVQKLELLVHHSTRGRRVHLVWARTSRRSSSARASVCTRPRGYHTGPVAARCVRRWRGGHAFPPPPSATRAPLQRAPERCSLSRVPCVEPIVQYYRWPHFRCAPAFTQLTIVCAGRPPPPGESRQLRGRTARRSPAVSSARRQWLRSRTHLLDGTFLSFGNSLLSGLLCNHCFKLSLIRTFQRMLFTISNIELYNL